MSLICTPSVVPPAPATPESMIVNDGFFPDIDPATLRALIRAGESVAAARIREAAIGAILSVGLDLAAWKVEQIAAGHATLAAVPAIAIDGQSRLTLLYLRAIASLVRAELTERNPETDMTPAGRARAQVVEPTIADLRRDATHAVRDILGRTRTFVELI